MLRSNRTANLFKIIGSAVAALIVLQFITTRAEAAGLSESEEAAVTVARLYYQVDHPIEVQVKQGSNRALAILQPDNTEVVRVDIADTNELIDLLEIILDIYKFDELVYAQLLIDGEPVGSPLVLQPLIDKYAPVIRYTQTAAGRTPVLESWSELPPAEQVMSGFRIYQESRPTLHTTRGDIVLVMRPDEAPNTCWNFLHLVDSGFYTQIPFHRIVEKDRQGEPFVIQAGDPSGTGSGGCAYEIDLEPTELPHDLGVISMARRGDDLDSASSQFFICLSRAGTSRLDRQYTSFGQTVRGIEVIQALAVVPVDRNDRPLEMEYITSAELIPAPPRTPGERPIWLGPEPKPEVPHSPGAVPGGDDPVDR